MADHSFSNWLPPLSLMPGNEQDEQEEAGGELFRHNNRQYTAHHHRPLSPFIQSEMNNVNQLAKLYQNIPIYGNGPLTDDEKSEIARRNENFTILPEGSLNRVDEDELIQRENENA